LLFKLLLSFQQSTKPRLEGILLLAVRYLFSVTVDACFTPMAESFYSCHEKQGISKCY